MSEEQLKAFLEKVQGDTSLQEKLKAAADANAVTAIAKEAGFSISADDLTKAQSELSEEELEGVAAGARSIGGYCTWDNSWSSVLWVNVLLTSCVGFDSVFEVRCGWSNNLSSPKSDNAAWMRDN